jgi:RNA polymerase sigma factor (sigma-70 family)
MSRLQTPSSGTPLCYILPPHVCGLKALCTGRVVVSVDNELIKRCVKDDQVAWNDLVSRYQRLVYSIAITLCPHPEDASDVFQQVWMDLYRNLSVLRDAEALPAWLITVTRRRAQQVRSARRPFEPLPEDLPDLSHQLTMIENEHALERALEALPVRCRRLVDLLYFTANKLSYVEIARETEMPVASIGPTRARCLEKLKKLLG